MSKKKIKSITILASLTLLCVEFFLLMISYTLSEKCFLGIVWVVQSIAGILSIAFFYYMTSVLVCPFTVFSLVWLILISFSSGEAPLLEAMNIYQWRYCIFGAIWILLGIIGSCFVKFSKKEKVKDIAIKKQTYYFLLGTIVLSSFCIVFQAVVHGGFPIFASNTTTARASFLLPGFSVVSFLGIIAVYIISLDKKLWKRKLVVALVMLYALLLLSTAVRFMFFLMVLQILSSFGLEKIKFSQLKKIGKYLVILVIAFMIVTNYRGGTSEKKSYFIDTGIYSGSDEALVSSELIRYFGMSQRVMELYLKAYPAGVNNMKYTLYPVLSFFDIQPEIQMGGAAIEKGLSIYGYTAKNIITFFYLDAGICWGGLMSIWSFLISCIYWKVLGGNRNIVELYLWSVSFISLVMSFYCYVDAYAFWLTYYLAYAWIVELIQRKSKWIVEQKI